MSTKVSPYSKKYAENVEDDKHISIAITGGIGSGKTFIHQRMFATLDDTRIRVDNCNFDNLIRSMYHQLNPDDEFIVFIANNILNNPKDIKQYFDKYAYRDQFYLKVNNFKQVISDIVFSDPVKYKIFNEYMKKYSTDLVKHNLRYLDQNRYPDTNQLLLFEIPLLYEMGLQYLFDYTVVIEADRQLREDRAMQRDHTMTKEKFAFIDSRQIPIEEKKKYADFVISNPNFDKLNSIIRNVDPQIYTFYQQIGLLVER
jgi:dephospho-CoA kinase